MTGRRSRSDSYVQELFGHATIADTLDTYLYLRPGMSTRTARAMEDALTD